MAMPWFRMYAEWASDPVVQSLAFEDQRHHAVLLCLKCNGTLDRAISPEQRERIIVRGLGLDSLTAAEAKRRLIEVGLIDDSWQPNGWDKRQYASDISTNRVRNHRKNKETGNVSETFKETSGNGFGNAPDTEQNRYRTDTETTSAETSSAPVVLIPLNNGEDFPIHENQCAEWGTLFPAVDVPQELRAMRAWCIANPRNRKTRSGVLRFATSWLTRAQNSARPNGATHAPRERIDNSAPARVERAIAEKQRQRSEPINGKAERVD